MIKGSIKLPLIPKVGGDCNVVVSYALDLNVLWFEFDFYK